MTHHKSMDGMHARYHVGDRVVSLHIGESTVYEWPVARNELPDGSDSPQWKVNDFAAKKLRELFDIVYRMEE